jgi:hypothetical protein
MLLLSDQPLLYGKQETDSLIRKGMFMKTGICPKCNSVNIFMKQGGMELGRSSMGVRVPTTMMTEPSAINCYICIDCGYFENYIVDADKLADVAEKWQRVEPQLR